MAIKLEISGKSADFSATAGWLWLVMVMGVANPRIHELIRKFPDIRKLYYAMQDPDNGFLKEKEYQKVRETPASRAEQVAEACQTKEIHILTWNSPDYPGYLKLIYNPPVVLFYRGSCAEILHCENILTVVGTRHPSHYSVYVGEQLCYELARQDVIIASGGALGLDSVAHHSAIRAGKPTIAIMGCGLDCDYPKTNRELREKILETGILLSEYFPGTPAYGRNFPIRNRILAGIGKGVLLLEASEKSGAMITANNACEQGRTVFCVPPADIFQNRYAGQASLLRDGATPVFGLEDILSIREHTVYEPEELSGDSEILENSGNFKNSENPPVPALNPAELEDVSDHPEISATPDRMPQEASPAQRKILELLRDGMKTSNMLCQLTGQPFDDVSADLLEMELFGWIVHDDKDQCALSPDLA